MYNLANQLKSFVFFCRFQIFCIFCIFCTFCIFYTFCIFCTFCIFLHLHFFAFSTMGSHLPISFKYLGTWVSNKLTLDAQLSHIRTKSNFLSIKLYPLLRETSLSFRINLWEIFVKPLFDQLVHLYYADGAQTNRVKADRLLKYTFKRFTLLAKSTPDKLIYYLWGYSLVNRAVIIFQRDKAKWDQRNKQKPSPMVAPVYSQLFHKAIFPQQVQTFINLTRSLCKVHRSSILNPEHIKKFHNPQFPSYTEVFSKLESLIVYKVTLQRGKPKHTLDRFSSLEVTRNYVNRLISCLLELSSSRAISNNSTTQCK